MQEPRIAFIGGGNMAGSMIGGLLELGRDPSRIRVADPQPDCRANFTSRGIACFADNAAAVADASVVVLAVKPQQMRAACIDIGAAVRANRALLISIAAGTSTSSIAAWIGETPAIVRCMPNTPALLRCGATALYANPQVDEASRTIAHDILASVGYAAWVEREDALHAVTALSGSGPAYFFLVMEAMEQVASALGLEPALARRLVAQTALGSARMVLETGTEVAELRRRVTSPGGTTERALRVFEERGLRQLIAAAVEAAAQRSRELADEPNLP